MKAPVNVTDITPFNARSEAILELIERCKDRIVNELPMACIYFRLETDVTRTNS